MLQKYSSDACGRLGLVVTLMMTVYLLSFPQIFVSQRVDFIRLVYKRLLQNN